MKSMFYLIKRILSLLNENPNMFIRDFHEHIKNSKQVRRCMTSLIKIDFIEIDSTFIKLTKNGKIFINDLDYFDDSEIDKALETLSVHYLVNRLDKMFTNMVMETKNK